MDKNLLEIECTILGTLLNDSTHVGEVAAELRPEDFSENMSRSVYGAITKLHFSGSPINRVTVLHELGDAYTEAIDAICRRSTGDIMYYCEMMLSTAQLKRIQVAALSVSTAESLEAAAEGIDKLTSASTSRRKIDSQTASDAMVKLLLDIGKPEKQEFMRLCVDYLDERIDIEPGDVIGLGGYPSAGKTLLSLQFAATLAEKYRVGYFSLETSTEKLTRRLASYLSKIPLKNIKRQDLSKEQTQELIKAGDKANDLQLYFVRASGWTVRDIQAYAINNRLDVVFVDYLQLLSDSSHNRSRYDQVTGISMDLHTMAQSNGITVFALSQLSRPEKSSGKPKPPSMSDFRESGQIEQDLDVALLLYQEDPNDYRSRRKLKISKNKEGEKGEMTFDFDGATQTMTPAKQTKCEHFREVNKKIREAGRAAAESRQMSFQELTDDDEPLPF